MEWMILPFKRYADFEGRSQRKEYWLYQLFTIMVYFVIFAIILAGLPWSEMTRSSPNYDPNAAPGPVFWLGMVLLVLWYLGTFIPDIAVTVRRFHDQDQSGWMYLLPYIPYMGWLVRLVFMCIEGTRGPNSYGPDPRDPGGAGIFE